MKIFSSNFDFLGKIQGQMIISTLFILIPCAIIFFIPNNNEVSTEILGATSLFCLITTWASMLVIKNIGRYPGVEEYSYVLIILSIAYGLLILLLLMFRIPYSRSMLVLAFIANLIFLILLYSRRRKSIKLCIGVVPQGRYEDVTMTPHAIWRILEKPESDVSGIHAITVDLWSNISPAWERRLAIFALKGLPVYDLKHLKESLTGKVEIEHLSENIFGTLSPLNAWMSVKHIMDWAFALLSLLIFMPFLCIVGIIIKIDSPGPIIFRQLRIGYQGKPFKVYKFRTMTVASEKTNESSQNLDAAMTKDGDRRVTRFGRILRQSRIDELPQLLNILRCEMSWIGPRPEAEVLSHWYDSEIPFYQYRHIVRPGITGWAQVHQGHVSNIKDVTEKLHYDFYYIKHFSLWIDFIVVARTIRTILTGFGAR